MMAIFQILSKPARDQVFVLVIAYLRLGRDILVQHIQQTGLHPLPPVLMLLYQHKVIITVPVKDDFNECWGV